MFRIIHNFRGACGRKCDLLICNQGPIFADVRVIDINLRQREVAGPILGSSPNLSLKAGCACNRAGPELDDFMDGGGKKKKKKKKKSWTEAD